MKRLDWEKLFNEDRIREDYERDNKDIPIRNNFDADYERIIYSSSVRRLQDKAQVFPLQRNDFTRTRLTHSLEVASLGRSIAWQIAEKMYSTSNNGSEEIKSMTEEDCLQFKTLSQMKRLPSLVEVASLVHDLGNTPFGHYGEEVIKKWFSKFFVNDEEYGKNLKLSLAEKEDFTNFDGNAQTIHILCKLQFLNDEYGANFTYGTLATLMKYPWNSCKNGAPKGYEKKQKFGYLQSESGIYSEIQNKVGIGPQRHPATFIVEAADDIAYKTADLEDGVKKGLVNWSDIEDYGIPNLFFEACKNNDRIELYNKYIQSIEKAEKNKVPNIELIKYQNLKIYIQNLFVNKCILNFVKNYKDIMEGNYFKSLLEDDSLDSLITKLDELTFEKCFKADEVVTLELVGDKVISDLLSLFIPAIINIKDASKAKTKEQKMIRLISDNFLHVYLSFNNLEHKQIFELRDYQKIQLVVDFISGMTDSYAVNLHKKLMNGII